MREIAATPVTVGTDHFRSLTEARFAVAMRALGLEPRYEPGTLRVGTKSDGSSLWYKPDFILPEFNLMVEVKPTADIFRSDPFAAQKVSDLASWPLPVMVWFWEEERGLYLDRWDLADRTVPGEVHLIDPRIVLLERVTFERCQACNRTVLVGSDPARDDEWVTIGHGCGLPHDGGRAWNRAVALARGWRRPS